MNINNDENIKKLSSKILKCDIFNYEEILNFKTEISTFIKKYNVKTKQFCGLNFGDNFEYLYTVENESFIDTDFDKDIKLKVNNEDVSIGPVSSMATLCMAIGDPHCFCNHFGDSPLFKTISIKLQYKGEKLEEILSLTELSINKAISKSKNYIKKLDYFKPFTSEDSEEMDEEEVLLDDINMDVINFRHKHKNKILKSLIKSYRDNKYLKFTAYFEVLEILSKGTKIPENEEIHSSFHVYFKYIQEDIKKDIFEKLDINNDKYIHYITYIREIRNTVTHPICKDHSVDHVPISIILNFQKTIIERILSIQL